jgi:uncharacterized protein YbbC (DUF1343 family)/CubicO group peptidase (beta-lactamase class C family)
MKISRRSLFAHAGFGPALGYALGAPQRGIRPIAGFAGSAPLDAVIRQAIEEDQVPGAVLIVSHRGRIVHRKAYGNRAMTPRKERMTLDTIFDAASLTKVVATTSAVMKLFEQGKLRLNDRVTEYLEEFQGGHSDITVRSLLTHFSGLRADLDLEPVWSGYETGIELALNDKPVAPPGSRFIYSDINFILLGEIVRRLSGEMLSDFVYEAVFRPLRMRETQFRPPPAWQRRIAPTEIVDGRPLRGIVHDPTTRYMGGIAGHAGLFTTASDLVRFAEMMLGKGTRQDVRIFRPGTVEKFTTPQTPPNQPVLRGLGWDIESPFSGNRGELFPIGSYGHTGFTGTSLWIDPTTSSFVILLANSVHPSVRPAITSLRGRVSTVAASSLGVQAPGITITGYNETLLGSGLRRTVARNAATLTGLDLLVEQKFAPLNGLRVGLITNHTGLDREGVRNVDRMAAAGVKPAALFSPEHGLGGREDREEIGHTTDAATGIPVFSLYSGENRRPRPEMLADIDALVFDIQDIGARFYTYITTMGYGLEAAAARRIPFFVLDRPNPITGTRLEGPLLDPDLLSFVGYFPLPLRHGMTAGELALLFNAQNRIGADLKVVAMRNWQRGDWFDSTGLVWTDPSPNMRSLNAAVLYPGIAMLEGSKNYSVGRGTDAPFEQVGADWIRGVELARYLNARFIPGVRVYPTRFTPSASRLAGKLIEGIRFVVTDRESFPSAALGLEIAAAIHKLYPDRLVLEDSRNLIGNQAVMTMLRAGEDPRLILESIADSLQAFSAMREEYLLYPLGGRGISPSRTG